MLKKFYPLIGIISIISLSILISCNQKPLEKSNTLKIRITDDANSLNPLKARGEISNYICSQIFQTLIYFDYQSNKPIGVLAKGMPTTKKTDSTTTFTYSLRDNISFDQQNRITNDDILFSFKLAICPGIVPKGSAAYYSFIDSLYFPTKSELKIQTHGDYFLNKYFTGDFFILPKHVYDPSGVLDLFSISDLRKDSILENSLELKAFTNSFNDIKFEKDQNYIKGSGPYEILEWTSNQRIILKRKENWWAANIENESVLFQQNQEKIQYEIISDNNTAISAFKSGKVDFIKTINPNIFAELQTNNSYQTAKETKSGYEYLAFNLNKPILNNIKIRKAIAHLINKQELIDKIHLGNAKETNSPISSYHTEYINSNLKTLEFSVDSAISILNEIGWKDSDNNGILDKTIGTNLQELSFEYLFNSNDDKRKSFGIILQNRAKSIGIEIKLTAVDWPTYLEKIRSGDFDIFYGSKGSAPIPPDLYTSFHSNSTNNGRNYSNYRSAISDSLIEEIRNTDSDIKRIQLYKKLQELLQKDLPVIFLVEPMETFLYSQTLKPILTSPVRPNYWAPSIEFKD
jgi:peptide/nickel transport system substrate-binding protein